MTKKEGKSNGGIPGKVQKMDQNVNRNQTGGKSENK